MIPRRQFLALAAARAVRVRDVYAEVSGRALRLGNRFTEWTFDLDSGAVRSFRNSRGRVARVNPTAASLVRLWFGSPSHPDGRQAAVTLSYRGRVVPRLLADEDAVVVEFRWPALGLAQTHTLAAGDPALRLRTSVEVEGPEWLTGLALGIESLTFSAKPAEERLALGDERGSIIDDPRHHLPARESYIPIPAGRRSFNVPPTVPASLIVGWMDLATPGLGLGIGYLDRQELDILGEVQAAADGISLGWRLFRLEGGKGFMTPHNGRQIYPLAPGEQFTSDEWILVAHEGDWRQTASSYRRRYEQVFQEDFVSWERLSPAVRECDLVLNSHVAWGVASTDPRRPYDYPRGRVIHRFTDLAPLIKNAVRELEVEPKHVIVNVLGTGPEWGIYHMPDHFPMNAAAGGQQAAEQMVQDLIQFGVAGICCYAHPCFLHRSARNYLPAADSGLEYPHQAWHESMGGIADLASPEWQALWRQEIFPRYKAMGVNGLYFDEGFGHHLLAIKGRPKSALTLLTEQSRGATRIYRDFRAVMGPAAFTSCESGSDVQARWIDLWHFGTPNEIWRYTHPDRMIKVHVNRRQIRESVARAWLLGCPLLVAPFPTESGAVDALEGEMLEALRAFVASRRRLREARAPGYPWQFRDVDGLRAPGIQAKRYGQSTVVYWAPERFDGEIRLDGIRRKLRASAGEMGFLVIA